MHYVIVGSFKPAMRLSLLDNMYLGYFSTETSGPIPNGEIKGEDGISGLCELVFGDGERLEFTQIYEDGRRYRHSLRRDQQASHLLNAWVGTCRDDAGNERFTKCIISSVGLGFLA